VLFHPVAIDDAHAADALPGEIIGQVGAERARSTNGDT
jgi:hypothetical protein